MNKKYFLNHWYLFVFICLFVFISVHSVLAADSTPSAQEIEKSLQDRIKKAIEDNLPIVQKEVDDKAQNGQFKAFVGTIESISGKTITINTVNGIKQTLTTDQTSIVNQGKSGADIEDLPINDTIISIGQTTDLQTQTATKIIVTKSETVTKRFVIPATITQVNAQKKIIKLISSVYDETTNITISSKAQFFTLSLDKSSLDEIQADQKVIVVIHDIDDEPILTRLIQLNETPKDQTETVCGDDKCDDPETPETCPKDCQS